MPLDSNSDESEWSNLSTGQPDQSSRFKVLLFVTYSIIQNIIRSGM